MKNVIRFLTLIITLSACAQQKEIIDWDKATINNKLTLTINKRDFEKIYKKADKIVKPDYNSVCGGYPEATFQYVYYKGAMFQEDNGVMNFRHIIFAKKNGMFFTADGQNFDGSTTLKQFAAKFPEAADNMQNVSFESMDNLQMATLLSENADGAFWHFYFSKGMLVAIEARFECE